MTRNVFGLLTSSLFILKLGTLVEGSKPHIIFVLADDLGWSDVGFHGSNQIETPNLDALAYNGLILNSHYSENLCTPSRAALLTGKYPIHTGTQHNVIVEASPWGLPLNETLMPQHLARLGYVSHALGKWHLGFFKKEYTPTYRGFNSHYGFWNSHQDYFTHYVQASFSPYEGMDMRDNMKVDWSSRGKYTTRLLTEKAEKIIKNHDAAVPLFLYLAHLGVHSGNYEDPLQAPEETIRRFDHIQNEEKRVYAAMLWELDQSVGRIITALDEKGILDNTIVVLVSDNGAPTRGLHRNTGSNWPLKGEKTTPWEGALRTVATVWSTKIRRRHRVVNNLMHISDWLPTLYAAAGGNVGDLGEIDGVNQWDFFQGKNKEPRTEILQNIDDTYGYAALRYGPFKYVNGTAFLGYLDYWFGTPDPTSVKYNITSVLSSTVSLTLGPTRESTMVILRRQATVQCPNPPHSSNCDSKVSPCLFNIVKDPCETKNIISEAPTIARVMEIKLKGYRRSMVPPGNQRVESIANPIYYNNTWTNWGDFRNETHK